MSLGFNFCSNKPESSQRNMFSRPAAVFPLLLKHSLFPSAPPSAAGTELPNPLSLILTEHLSEHPGEALTGQCLRHQRTQQTQSQFTCYWLDCLGVFVMWHDRKTECVLISETAPIQNKLTMDLPSAEIFALTEILEIFDIFVQWHWNYRLTLNRLGSRGSTWFML